MVWFEDEGRVGGKRMNGGGFCVGFRDVPIIFLAMRTRHKLIFTLSA
jgi:hypothetical protein